MKRIFIIILLIMILVVPAAASLKYSFQNPEDYTDWSVLVGSIESRKSSYGDDIIYLHADTNQLFAPFNQQIGYIAATYYPNTTTSAEFYLGLYDSSGTLIGYLPELAWVSSTYPYARFEFVRDSPDWYIYINGNQYGAPILTGTTETYYIRFFTTGGWDVQLKDLVIGSDAPYIISDMPDSYSISKDLLDPTLTGLYDDKGNNLYSNRMHISYGLKSSLPGAPSGTFTAVIRNLITGTIYNTTVINTSVVTTPYNFANCSGTIAYNLTTMLFNSGAPYGIYTTGLYRNSGLEDMDWFLYSARGATITWDKGTYVAGDTATITTSVSGTYWDTATYTYTGKIFDLYGDEKDSWSIASQTQSEDIDLTGYSEGDYIAVIIASSGGTDYYMAADYATVEEMVNIAGYTMNGLTGSLLSGPWVNMTQTASWDNETASGGIYNKTGFSEGSAIGVYGSHPGFNHSAFSWTPAASGSYNINLTFIPNVVGNSTGSSAGSIVGIAYEDWSHNPLPGATIYISNTTWTGSSNTTNAAGYYEFHELAAGNSYIINASASGYDDSIDYSRSPIAGQHIIQDCGLSPLYILGVECRDEETDALITASTLVESSDGQSVTTTSGRAQFTLDYGAYSITGSTEGYYVASRAVLMTTDRNITLEFSQIPSSSGAGVSYPSHNVKFTVLTFFGQPISEANVTAKGYQTTVGPWEWLKTLLGIPLDETPIHNQTMEGTTDTGGQIDFMMIESVKYRMTFYKLGAINKTITIYPKDDYYVIFADAESFFTGGCNEAKNFNFTVSTSHVTGNRYNVILNTTDALNGTTSCRLIYNRTAQPGKPVTIGDVTRTWTCNDTFQVWNTTGVNQSIIVHLNITHTSCGFVQRDYVITFKGAQVTMGLPAEVLPWIAAMIIIFTALLFGATSAEAGALIACFEGWIFYAIGWFDSMGNLTAITVLSLATVIAIMSLVMTRSRRERFV